MSGATTFDIQTVSWSAHATTLQAIRRAVFVIEQHVPEEDEWDDQDAASQHVLALVDNVPVGSGRLLPDGHIGRMAVLKPWRGQGVGRALLAALLVMARQRGYIEAVLHAQTHALNFYKKQGFLESGPEFMEAGIPHRVMRLKLPD